MTHHQTIHQLITLRLSAIHTRNQENGFTLAETLITVLLIGVLFAIAAPSYFTWVNNKRIEDILTQVEGAFKEAQSEALRKGQSCIVTIDMSGLQIQASTRPAPGENCLPTGNRDFSTSNPNLDIESSFTTADPLIFTFKKTTPQSGIVVLSLPDASRPRCIVVSEGIGLIRTGYYTVNPPVTPLDETHCSRNP